MSAAAQSRPDRSAAVKDSIRRSAFQLFTTRGFDGTGIREIAADAAVNPAIVIRHFESKENLFIQTVDPASMWPPLLDGPIEGLGERIVLRILRGRDKGLRLFGETVRASGRPDIRSRLQEAIAASLAPAVAAKLDGPSAELRAHLFAAQLIGLMTALTVYDDDYLIAAPAVDIASLYGGSLQRLLTEPETRET